MGSCHTPDAAYALLQDLREDRVRAIEAYNVSKIKENAVRIRIDRLLNSSDEADVWEGKAQQLELENNNKHGEVLYQAACDELAFIDDCISKVNANRKYKHLSDAESCQVMQQEEWKLELINRAENYLLTMGTIPADHFETMRMHPEFTTSILPSIDAIRVGMQTQDGIAKCLESKKGVTYELGI